MGIKQTDIQSFLEPESQGFLYDTARSFLKRHSNPESLLAQLKNLASMGQMDACRDMIQLIIREGHDLGDQSETYILRAQISFEQGENMGEVMAWLQQAKLCKDNSSNLQSWEKFLEAREMLRDGDTWGGQQALEELLNDETVRYFAQYELAHHTFWKTTKTEMAVELLEDLVMDKPSFVKAWSTLGYAYNRLGQKDKAQDAFGQCIELDPNPERVKVYKQQIAS